MNIFDFSAHLYEYGMRFFRTMADRALQQGVANLYRMMANDCESLLHTCRSLKKLSGSGMQTDPAALCHADEVASKLFDEGMALAISDDIEAYAYLTRIAERMSELERGLLRESGGQILDAAVERLLQAQGHEAETLSQAWDFVSAPQHFLAWGEFSNAKEFGNFGRHQT